MMKKRALERLLKKRSEGRTLLTKDPQSRAMADSESRRDAAIEMKKGEWLEILENHKRAIGSSQDAGLEFLTNNTIGGFDPWYGCNLDYMMIDFAVNHSDWGELYFDEFIEPFELISI